MSIRVTLFAATLLFASACGVESGSGGGSGSDGSSEFPADSTEIRYDYNDASVPPEYHRSRSVTIDAEETEVVIDSYGDEIGSDRADTDADMWEEFLADLDERLDELPDAHEHEDGCTGGTSSELEVSVDGETEFLAVDDVCGGGGELSEAMVDLIDEFLVDLDPDT